MSFDSEDAELLGEVIESAESNNGPVCAERGTQSYTHLRHIDDLGRSFERALEEFFVSYDHPENEDCRMSAVKGPAQGWRQVDKCRKRARRHA